MILAYEPRAYAPAYRGTLGQVFPAPVGGKIVVGHSTAKMGLYGNLILAGVGGAVAYGSSFVPHAKVQKGVMLAGFVMGGLGVINIVDYFVSDIEAAPTVTEESVPGNQLSDDVRQVTGAIIQPARNGSIERSLFAETYPVKFRVSNPTKQTLKVQVEFRVEEWPRFGGKVTTTRSYIVELMPNESKVISDKNYPISGTLTGIIDAVGMLWVKGSADDSGRQVDSAPYTID